MTNKKQEKGKAAAAAAAKNKQSRKDREVNAFRKYQTPLKNSDKQKEREEAVRKSGLPGHASGTSSSKQNRATTQNLNRINKKNGRHATTTANE